MSCEVHAVAVIGAGKRLPPLTQLWAISGERALSGTTAIVLPLAAGVATGHVWAGATASLGGFTALYGHNVSYRRRGKLLAGVGTAMTASAAVGAALVHAPYWLALALGLIAAAATVATEVWRVGPPGAVMVVLVGGTASSATARAPAQLAPAGRVGLVALLVGAGCAVAWLAGMARWLRHPVAVEQRAVRAAVGAVDAFVGEPTQAGRSATAKAIRVARGALAGASRRDPDAVRDLGHRLDAAQRRFLRVAHLDAATAVAAWPAAGRIRPRRGGWAWSHAAVLPTAGRVGAAVGVSGALAAVVGLPIYWAAVTAVAVLQGPDLRTSRQRVWHRAVGTVVGVLLAGLLLALHAPLGAVVAFVAVLQLVVEILVVHVYALAVVFITPLTLLLAAVAAPGTGPGALVTLRLQETAIGCLVAFALGNLLWPRASSRRLAMVTEAALEAIRSVLARPDRAGAVALQDRLLTLHAVAVSARGELFTVPGRDLRLERSRQVEDLGWTVLSAVARGEDDLLDAVRRVLARQG